MMDASKLISRAWQYVVRNRALWLFGVLLAMTTVSGGFPSSSPYRANENQPMNIPLRIGDDTTIYLPGSGLEIDINDAEGLRITFENGRIYDLNDDMRRLEDYSAIDLWTLIIFIVIWSLVLISISSAIRYVSETALIRMVDAEEMTGSRQTIAQGFRLGWSRRAFRLFLIDLAIFLVVGAFATLLLALLIWPILFLVRGTFPGIFFGSFGALGFLFSGGFVITIFGALLSFLMQIVRRGIVVEDLGIFDAFRLGFRLLRTRFKDIGMVWIIWIGVRILWAAVSVIIAVLLIPVFIVAVFAGLLVGAIPAFVVGIVVNAFTSAFTAAVIGLLVGIPFFGLIVASPILLVSGGVEVFKSALWTLAFRAIRFGKAERIPAAFVEEAPPPETPDETLPDEDVQ